MPPAELPIPSLSLSPTKTTAQTQKQNPFKSKTNSRLRHLGYHGYLRPAGDPVHRPRTILRFPLLEFWRWLYIYPATTSHFYNTTDTFTASCSSKDPAAVSTPPRAACSCSTLYDHIFFLYSAQSLRFSPVNFAITPPGYTNFSLGFGDNTFDSSENKSPFHMYRVPNHMSRY